MIKKWFSTRLTFMVVPHGGGCPRQINVHISILLLAFGARAGITLWGSYLSAQQVDYWRAQATNEAMKLKVKYLLAQLDQSHAYLDEVKTVDVQLRDLLQYRNTSALIKNQKPIAEVPASLHGGTGGPSFEDASSLARFMNAVPPDVSWQALVQNVASLKNEAENRLTSFRDLSSWIDTQRHLFRATPIGWPTVGTLTSHYGARRSPFSEGSEFHPGLDISNVQGTPVRATADGVVRIADWKSGYGKLVVLQHAFGYSTRYAHNSRLMVKEGDVVKRGQVVALMGTTGKSTGPHCHYEVWRNNIRRDPLPYLREDANVTGKNSRSSLN
jgi:murein DD-endopeptidase MepM/ murein hydrolase activator NlpD